MSELGPASKALLDVVNETFGFISQYDTIAEAATRTDVWHSENWWFRRLVALALESRIEVHLHREGDSVAFRFRRRQEAK